MKKILYFVAALAVVGSLSSCKEEVPPVYGDESGVYVHYINYHDITFDSLEMSFLDVTGDTYTLNLRVMLQGRVDYDNDRHFVVRQIIEEPVNTLYDMAISGDDFEPLDNALMVIPKGRNYGLLPITLKKSDHLLSFDERGGLELYLELVDAAHSEGVANDFEHVGSYRVDNDDKQVSERTKYKIKYTYNLVKPGNWGTGSLGSWSDAFGVTWGPVKHNFILETMRDNGIDFSFSTTITTTNYLTFRYYGRIAAAALAAYNQANPGNELREEPIPPATIGEAVVIQTK